ncbi:MAG: FxDxF family PEP-CTERM protein [Rhodocyclaceae bacterium]|nr:FxDxF family PEP-CTERM protein [Rhodocyclaceae bacterium]
MNALKQVSLALATAGLLTSGVAQAALNDRGGGLLYDDVLNVTWLQDANYAKTSGYDADGRMDNWNAANTWASSLNISRVAGESLSGWRLPATAPVGTEWAYGMHNSNYAKDGSQDVGYNITSPHSELSYMYYVNLGLKGYYSPAGVYQSDYGATGTGDVGLVKNLQGRYQGASYWSGTVYAAAGYPGHAWHFITSLGLQHGGTMSGVGLYAWAVRPGDVAAVPEPETYGMLLAGLGLLGFVARRRKQKLAA